MESTYTFLTCEARGHSYLRDEGPYPRSLLSAPAGDRLSSSIPSAGAPISCTEGMGARGPGHVLRRFSLFTIAFPGGDPFVQQRLLCTGSGG